MHLHILKSLIGRKMKVIYLVLNFYYYINSIQSACVNKNECSFGYIRDNNDCIECGLIPEEPNVKIVGGIEAIPHSYPSQAFIVFHIKSKETFNDTEIFVQSKKVCGGTLINRYTVLTAAHCTYLSENEIPSLPGQNKTEIEQNRESAMFVYFGVHNTSSILNNITNIPENVKMHRIEKIIDHPQYHVFTIENDISMLILTEPVEFTKEIQPACLPSVLSSKFPEPNSDVFVSGWGLDGSGNYPTQLNNVKLKIFESSKCEIFEYDLPLNWSKQICAGEEQKDTCSRDSGGGLYIDSIIGDKLKRIVTGIVSFGVQSCTSPGVYTRVSFYLDWIKENWRMS